jgi:hypothetical protein
MHNLLKRDTSHLPHPWVNNRRISLNETEARFATSQFYFFWRFY